MKPLFKGAISSLFLLVYIASYPLAGAVSTDSSTYTFPPAVTVKLDAFMVKVQALRPRYPSDTDWNVFLTNLRSKINVLKPQYTGNTLILAVLDRLSV